MPLGTGPLFNADKQIVADVIPIRGSKTEFEIVRRAMHQEPVNLGRKFSRAQIDWLRRAILLEKGYITYNHWKALMNKMPRSK